MQVHVQKIRLFSMSPSSASSAESGCANARVPVMVSGPERLGESPLASNVPAFVSRSPSEGLYPLSFSMEDVCVLSNVYFALGTLVEAVSGVARNQELVWLA